MLCLLSDFLLISQGLSFGDSDSAIEIKGLTVIGRATIVALQMNRPVLLRARAMWVKLGEHPPKLD